jgi:site-specific DNA-methyltransferase (adenine-specific)
MRHSEKPPEVRERIVTLMGDIPRVELFARVKTEGWSVWGNEVTSDVTMTPNVES